MLPTGQSKANAPRASWLAKLIEAQLKADAHAWERLYQAAAKKVNDARTASAQNLMASTESAVKTEAEVRACAKPASSLSSTTWGPAAEKVLSTFSACAAATIAVCVVCVPRAAGARCHA
ncbi:hypothetical protein EON66_06370 [archaeon]|nr:MAG: hypothetical protein EON66_06370 [archaeon]